MFFTWNSVGSTSSRIELQEFNIEHVVPLCSPRTQFCDQTLQLGVLLLKLLQAPRLIHRDRVPIDYGAMTTTGVRVNCVAALHDYYGIERRPVRVHEPFQMLGTFDEDLMQAMGLDDVDTFARSTMFGFPADEWKAWRLNGLEILEPKDFNTTVDAQGNTWIYPEGDLFVAPSGCMRSGGYFFDCVVPQEPIDEDILDAGRHIFQESAQLGVEDRGTSKSLTASRRNTRHCGASPLPSDNIRELLVSSRKDNVNGCLYGEAESL